MGNLPPPTVAAVARVELSRGHFGRRGLGGNRAHHVGASADRRSIAIAEANGYPLASHRARQFARRISAVSTICW
jgi:hypothetical protein